MRSLYSEAPRGAAYRGNYLGPSAVARAAFADAAATFATEREAVAARHDASIDELELDRALAPIDARERDHREANAATMARVEAADFAKAMPVLPRLPRFLLDVGGELLVGRPGWAVVAGVQQLRAHWRSRPFQALYVVEGTLRECGLRAEYEAFAPA